MESTFYFDANALWKFYQKGELGTLNIRRLVANSAPVLISPLTAIEFFGILTRSFRQGTLRKKDLSSVAKRFRRDMSDRTNSSRPFRLITITDNAYYSATKILLNHATTFSIGSNDSLHLSIVQALQQGPATITIVTSDNSMQNVCQKLSITFYDPEKE